MGIPPIHTQRTIITVKHYLKALTISFHHPSDNYLGFIMEEYESGNPEVLKNIKEVFKFLSWKLREEPHLFNENDKLIVTERHLNSLHIISHSVCFYTKGCMEKYAENLWQISMDNRLQQLGERRAPRVSAKNIPLPVGTSRQTEVILLSLFYKQNLLNSFLYLAQRKKCQSPMCVCLAGEQNAFHLLVECELVDYSVGCDF